MVFYLVTWAVLLGICLLVGASVLGVLGCPAAIERPADRLLATLWVGLLTLATALLALSVVAPLRPHWCALVATGLSLPALCSRHTIQTLKEYRCFCTLPVLLGVLAIALATAWLVLRGTLLEDARVYHIPRVRWYSEYGSVFGLALLDIHLGHTSTWHALTAPFDTGIFRGRVYALVNGFLCFLFAVNFLLVSKRMYCRGILNSDRFLAVASVIYFAAIIRESTQIVFSPSPNIAVSLLIVITSWIYLAESHPSKQGVRTFWLCSLGAIGVKLSLAPLVAVSMLVEFWRVRTSPPLVWRFFAATFFCLTPFFAVQFISTGFFLYPSTLLGGEPDWSLDPQTAEKVKVLIFTFPFDNYKSLLDPNSNIFLDWKKTFWSLAKNQCYFLFLSFINILVCCKFIFFRKEPKFYLVYVFALIGNIFILAGGPDIRFGFGYVHLGITAFIAIKIGELLRSKVEASKDSTCKSSFYWFLLITALTFLPLRLSTGAVILAWVGGSALLLLPFRHSTWLRTRSLPWQWTPFVAALTVAAGLAATACAKDATEMAIESYAGAGLLRLPENPVSRWLLPPPTIRLSVTIGPRGEIILANTRYETKTVGGYQYVFPVNGSCADAELPCGSLGIRPDIRRRDPERGLAGGFSRVK